MSGLTGIGSARARCAQDALEDPDALGDQPGLGEGDPGEAGNESGIFADPLNVLYASTGSTDAAVAEALRSAGVRVTAQYLGQIRSGRRRNVGSDVVRGLEAHFGLAPGYFYHAAGSPVIGQNPVVLAVRNPQVAAIALRAGELSPRGLSYLHDLIEQVRKWDLDSPGGRQDPTSAAAP